MKNSTILLTTITTALLATRLAACDFCACDLPSLGIDNRPGWHAGVSEQFTHFGTLQQDGQTIANPAGEHLNSSITQLIIGYDFTRALGVQMNVPLVYRSFQRWRNGVLENGSVSGLGDISFLAHYAPLHIQRSDFMLTARLYAGLSLPTGDSDRVLEEAAEAGGGEGEGEGETATVASGIHGHDLALGTGAVSGIFGADIHMQWKRMFATMGIEGVARMKGAHGYRYADEMSWHGSLGAVLVDQNDFTLALAAECTGASKGEDTFLGTRATDTAATVVYLGPKVSATWGKRYHADVKVEFPVLRENSGVQAVPDYRISATFGIQF